MARINENFLALPESYLFSDIAKRVSAFAAANPGMRIIRLGIGDVTLPLAPAVVEAMRLAVEEMGKAGTFRGYGPEQGYDFLRRAVAGHYARRGVRLAEDEIFISDGAKSDLGNLTDIFSLDDAVLVPDPVYPVYVDTNVMDGRRILHARGSMDNGFLPAPDPSMEADIVYLCSPGNPTGSVYGREGLAAWVRYALEHDAVIIFDAAYEAYISDPALPRSIYEVPGAERCAIEVCSLSKTAGFTGTRCGYTIVPKSLVRKSAGGTEVLLNRLWLRRQTTKFNGVPYVVQRGAAAVFTEEGRRQMEATIARYMDNARIMARALAAKGIEFVGGVNSPYLWLRCPKGMGSWEFFDHLLAEAAVVGTPGSGFGPGGEGFFRLSAFGAREDAVEAMERIGRLL